jgi:hypothetical protein
MLFVLDLAKAAHDVKQPALARRRLEFVPLEAFEEVLKRTT